MARKQQPKEILGRNLRWLLRHTKNIDIDKDQLSIRTGLSKQTIVHIMQEKSAPSIDTLENLANAFGLKGWQLLFGKIDQRLGDGTEDLIKNYIASSEDGKEHISQIAGLEANNSKNRHIDS